MTIVCPSWIFKRMHVYTALLFFTAVAIFYWWYGCDSDLLRKVRTGAWDETTMDEQKYTHIYLHVGSKQGGIIGRHYSSLAVRSWHVVCLTKLFKSNSSIKWTTRTP